MRNQRMMPRYNIEDAARQHPPRATGREPSRLAPGPAPAVFRRGGLLLGAALVLLSHWGCQCCPLGTNAYSTVIDTVADCPVRMDCVYCAKLDATRINRPGGWQCCNDCPPPPACCAAGVYAHRWNSPPVTDMTSPAGGLQGLPNFPADDLMDPSLYGPAFPENPGPQGLEDRAVPLFEAPMESITPSPQSSARPSANPGNLARWQPEDESGVVQMNYARPYAPRPVEAPLRPQVPVEVLFAP